MISSKALRTAAIVVFVCLQTIETHAQVPLGPLRDRVVFVARGASFATTMSGGSGVQMSDLSHKICDLSPCQVEIEVAVDTVGDPEGRRCIFNFPQVVVTKKKKTEIVWLLKELISKTNARFRDDASGGDGIQIYLGNTTAADFKNRIRQDKRFGWERDKDQSGGKTTVYFYDINVVHDFGMKRCDVPDPVIVNRD